MVAAPFILAGVGFASGGIVAGSLAASMMSSAAVASGGGVAAGSLVAILQSAGRSRWKKERTKHQPPYGEDSF